MLDRLEWLIENRAGGTNAELNRMAGLRPNHLNTILTRLRQNPQARIENNTLEAICRAARVRMEWLSAGDEPRDVDEKIIELPFRYDSLREVLEAPENAARWSDEAIAALKTVAFKYDTDPGPAYWTEQLDRWTSSLKASHLAPIRREPDPLETLVPPKRKKG